MDLAGNPWFIGKKSVGPRVSTAAPPDRVLVHHAGVDESPRNITAEAAPRAVDVYDPVETQPRCGLPGVDAAAGKAVEQDDVRPSLVEHVTGLQVGSRRQRRRNVRDCVRRQFGCKTPDP